MATETFVVENAGDLAIVYELALSFAEEGRPIDDYGFISSSNIVSVYELILHTTIVSCSKAIFLVRQLSCI